MVLLNSRAVARRSVWAIHLGAGPLQFRTFSDSATFAFPQHQPRVWSPLQREPGARLPYKAKLWREESLIPQPPSSPSAQIQHSGCVWLLLWGGRAQAGGPEGTLGDGHAVHPAQRGGCRGAVQQGQGVGTQGSGVGVFCWVQVGLQEVFCFVNSCSFFLRSQGKELRHIYRPQRLELLY